MCETKVLVSVDNNFKSIRNVELAKGLLVGCSVANIVKAVDVNFFTTSSSPKSNTHNTLKMMGEDVCEGVATHIYIAWTKHFGYAWGGDEPRGGGERCGLGMDEWCGRAPRDGVGVVHLPWCGLVATVLPLVFEGQQTAVCASASPTFIAAEGERGAVGVLAPIVNGHLTAAHMGHGGTIPQRDSVAIAAEKGCNIVDDVYYRGVAIVAIGLEEASADVHSVNQQLRFASGGNAYVGFTRAINLLVCA